MHPIWFPSEGWLRGPVEGHPIGACRRARSCIARTGHHLIKTRIVVQSRDLLEPRDERGGYPEGGRRVMYPAKPSAGADRAAAAERGGVTEGRRKIWNTRDDNNIGSPALQAR